MHFAVLTQIPGVALSILQVHATLSDLQMYNYVSSCSAHDSGKTRCHLHRKQPSSLNPSADGLKVLVWPACAMISSPPCSMQLLSQNCG